MSRSTAGLSDWLAQDPRARGELVIAAWNAKGSAGRYLAGIHDERLRDIVCDLTPGEVADVAGDGTNPFWLATAAASEASEFSGYVSAVEAENRSLRRECKQLADALAAALLRDRR